MTPEELTFIMLKEPAPEIDAFGNKFWYDATGNFHRDNDLPAVVRSGNPPWYQAWYQHGGRHRDNDLPAIVWENGETQFWENGKQIK